MLSFRGQKIYLLARRYPSASERLVFFAFRFFYFSVCFRFISFSFSSVLSPCVPFFLYFHFNGLSPFYVCILDIVNEVSLSLCLNLCFLLLLSLLSLCFTLHFSLSLSSFSPNFCLDFYVDFFFCFTFFCVETFVCVFSSKSQHLYTFFLLLKTNSKLLCFWTESLSNCCNRSGIYYFITRNSKKPIVLKCKIPSCFESPLETLSLSLPTNNFSNIIHGTNRKKLTRIMWHSIKFTWNIQCCHSILANFPTWNFSVMQLLFFIYIHLLVCFFQLNQPHAPYPPTYRYPLTFFLICTKFCLFHCFHFISHIITNRTF